MAYSDEQRFWIWLSSVQGLGPRRFDLLLTRSGRPQQVWEECGPWMEPFLGGPAYRALMKARNPKYLDRLFEKIEKAGAIAVTRQDDEYPARLRAIECAPPTLFVRGRATLPGDRTLAVVGARNGTAYGTRMARRLARDVSRIGVTVVSGLARGIDSAAHRGAVDASARTIAVLGSGVDVVYPPEHLMLADEILQGGGSLVSEYPPGTAPLRHHFPARNRIISGMSEGVLLIEAANASGTTSTITFAQEQSREVLALPGQADSPLSAFPHALVRQGAHLVTSAEDILEAMGWTRHGFHPLSDAPRPARWLPFTQTEQQLMNLLAGGPVDTDELMEQMALSPPEFGTLLSLMEMQGHIRKLPGRRVEPAHPDAP